MSDFIMRKLINIIKENTSGRVKSQQSGFEFEGPYQNQQQAQANANGNGQQNNNNTNNIQQQNQNQHGQGGKIKISYYIIIWNKIMMRKLNYIIITIILLYWI